MYNKEIIMIRDNDDNNDNKPLNGVYFISGAINSFNTINCE